MVALFVAYLMIGIIAVCYVGCLDLAAAIVARHARRAEKEHERRFVEVAGADGWVEVFYERNGWTMAGTQTI